MHLGQVDIYSSNCHVSCEAADIWEAALYTDQSDFICWKLCMLNSDWVVYAATSKTSVYAQYGYFCINDLHLESSYFVTKQ